MENADKEQLKQMMVKWRRHLHRNPEFGFEEFETASFVASRLREFGFEDVVTGVGGTGVIATLTRGLEKRSVALRADMDCLRIQETTALPYASCKPGLMHACGHDGHTAILLGAAAILANEDTFDGTVRFVFQPAEEWGQGMKAVIRDGLGTKFPFDEIYGLHIKPGLPLGHFSIRPGEFMAAEDSFQIRVKGVGGHASTPHLCKDALLCAASIVTELQTVVARVLDPAELAVLSVTSICGDNVKNAISSNAFIEGDCRHFSTETSKAVEASVRQIAQGVSFSHGCETEVNYERIFVPLINEQNATKHALSAARVVFGAESVTDNAPREGGAEDFAQALKIAPGAFANIGNGDSVGCHSSGFDFNDDALLPGALWFTELVRQRLPIK
ncbi:amidohydrolase [Cognatiyoonia sp. IB215446]|uniref:amidohydrolase n=1 Tax=Cognatiyoonia sp. IB215446 TaxID=3097355 RepID=UPI002A1545CC|nr:amidohydrolase [Cognatiyoonia sp. IB215446]MDX8350484.1 amidohydrolase [Cognatiyoonia sp. IB215446]